jgi:hypothetical protein
LLVIQNKLPDNQATEFLFATSEPATATLAPIITPVPNEADTAGSGWGWIAVVVGAAVVGLVGLLARRRWLR